MNVMRTLFLVSLIWSGCGGPAPVEQADAGLTCRGGTTACDICGYTSCCPEANACATSPQCSAAYSCSAACKGDAACINRCAAAQPNGIGLANALAVCLSSNCSQPCS